MLAERIERWGQDKEAKGLQQGMQRGEAELLKRLLTKRVSA